MTKVLVHGVPETSAVWDPLRSELALPDVVALQLPGFGCPLPDGFDAGKEAYVEWLVEELTALGHSGPVDVLGHDWGGGFVARIVSTRPELVRSWVTDAAGIATGGFEWHAVAKVWQTPGAGEDFFEGLLTQPPETVAPAFESLGMSAADALTMVSGIDSTMAGAVLALYRSAVNVGEEWAPEFREIAPPGLVLAPTDDLYISAGRSRQGSERSGAKLAELAGLGHWWMLQAPEVVAPILRDFWSAL
jgi:pimeloyl-ACP methyl ester carboxylesterase